jgi:hypothetical protein
MSNLAKNAQRAKFVHLANKSLSYSVMQSWSIASMTFYFPGFSGSAESLLSSLGKDFIGYPKPRFIL